CTMGFVAASWILFRTEDFAATWSIYQSWFGLHGRGGTTIDSPLILSALIAGGIAAFAGPTSQKFILDQLRPSRWVGLFAALALVGMILLIGGGLQSEFIYFQF
ncbi:MAG TPA: acyltransferase, partial [Alphaproteobacteria bacterium]|nr:acyltransferase [Alphaproteobacteria bacterium]